MKPTVIFPAETWAVYLRKVQEALKVDLVPFLRDELRRWLEMIVTLTPPDSTDQGAKAVRRDIGQLVRPISRDMFKSPKIQALLDRHDAGAFQAFAAHVPSLAGAKIVSASEIPELHRSHRDQRGRVRIKSALKNFVIGADDIRALRTYVAHKVGNVGMAIAGWLPGLHFVGGNVDKPVSVLDVPEHGSFRSTLDDSVKPSLEAINSSPWASRRDEGQRIISNARAARINALMSRFKHIVEGTMKKSGSNRQAA